jgi:methionyl-tRNA synthetase
VFSTGTDEHGQKVSEAAAAAGFGSELPFCDAVSATFHSAAQRIGAIFLRTDLTQPSPLGTITGEASGAPAGPVETTKRAGGPRDDADAAPLPPCARDPVHGHLALFTRTSTAAHMDTVRALWQDLARGGALRPGEHKGWYCVGDECFVPEERTRTDPAAPGGRVSIESGRPVVQVAERGHVLDIDTCVDDIEAWMTARTATTTSTLEPPSAQSNSPTSGEVAAGGDDAQHGEGAVWPRERRNEVLSWLRERPVPPLSVSRPQSRVSWGVPVPGRETDESVYVWLDALASYLTSLRAASHALGVAPADFEMVHIVGKDILRFHALHWPAIIVAASRGHIVGQESGAIGDGAIRDGCAGGNLVPQRWPLPARVVAHAHWTVGGVKMSKSLGNVVAADRLTAILGVDGARFFLLRDGGVHDDGDYPGDSAAIARCDSELAGVLGNLISRCVADKIGGVAVGVDPEAAIGFVGSGLSFLFLCFPIKKFDS